MINNTSKIENQEKIGYMYLKNKIINFINKLKQKDNIFF
jgi:hypothetical protein